MKRKRTLLTAMLLAAAMLFTACGSKPASDEPAVEARKDVSIGINADLATMDPQGALSLVERQVHMQIYGTLLTYGENSSTVPYLAESLDISEDGLTWIFKLKQGVLFSNGEEMKADDVVFTFDRLAANPSFASVMGHLASYTATDDYTVEVKMNDPYMIFKHNLCDSQYSILNRKAVEESGDDWSNPVGTGAYKLVEWAKGEKVVLAVNENYTYGEMPSIESISFKVVTDNNTMAVALQSGDIDMVAGTGVAASAVAQFENNPDYTMLFSATSQYDFFNLNTQKAPFNDIRVRQAIAHAVDKESIILMYAEGNGVAVNSQLSDGVIGYDPSIKGYEYDVEKAKALLAEAGYADGFEMTVYTIGARIAICEILQAQLSEIGITMKCEAIDLGAFLGKIGAGEYDGNVMGLGLSYPEGECLLNPMFNSVSAFNWCGFTDPVLDECILGMQASNDEAYRAECYSTALKILEENCPQIPLYYARTNLAHDSQLNLPYVPTLGKFFVADMSWSA